MRSDHICRTCPHGHQSINGTYCARLSHYVTHHTQPPCQNKPTIKHQYTMTTDITTINSQAIDSLSQKAIQSYRDNITSHQRCLQAGSQLLSRCSESNITEQLDQEIATYIERTRNTHRNMIQRRSAVTQMFDTIRSAYTSLENDINPTRTGTIPQQLQHIRNQYAAHKHQQQQEEQRIRQQEHEKAMAAHKYADKVQEDLLQQFTKLIEQDSNRLIQLEGTLTTDNYDHITAQVKATSEQLPEGWYTSLHTQATTPPQLTPQEAQTIAQQVKQRIRQRLIQQYEFEISSARDYILDRLHSRLQQLQLIAQATAAEAEQLTAQMQQQDKKDEEQRSKERAERQAIEKAADQLAAQKQETENLFQAAQIQATTYQTNITVKKDIQVLHPDGIMQVISMWWAHHGRTLTVEELCKEFKKQITFCNRLANDRQQPILIQSEHIRYNEQVKAR